MVKPSNDITKTKIEIISTQKTKTISGKSDLTYHIGKDKDSNQYIRIWVNSGNGYFSNEWIPVTEIIAILEQHNSEPASSIVFCGLFFGKSVNTPSFLSAVLRDAGMLKLAQDTKRKFVYTGAALKFTETKPRRTVKKTALKSTSKTAK